MKKIYTYPKNKFNAARNLFPRFFAALFATLITVSAFSQINVTTNSNAQALAQLLTGPGVTITNYTKTCDNNGSGTFVDTNAYTGIQQGVMLASGKVSSVPQAANNFASTAFTNSGDAQLSTLTTGTIYDKCVLEFDITPVGTDLKFNYVFASEEYPEFVCSPYNDVFGFFISGPKPGGGTYTNMNIATVPGSNLPVDINSVNPGVSGTYNGTTWNSGNCQSLNNTQYFIDNLNPINAHIVYDGMTVVLTANASVIPCQTYHLKLAIADVADRIYDSGVFLEAYSFTSTPYSTTVKANLNDPGFTSAVEGCEGGTFTVSISNPQPTAVTVNLTVTGTATNGTDYNTIPSSVIIPAGQTSVTIPMNAVNDLIAEGSESVIVSVLNQCSGLATTSDSLIINDYINASISVSDSTLCQGQSTQLTATGGSSYLWSPASSLNNATIANPTATPVATTTYSVTVTQGNCSRILTQTVYVSNPSVAINVTPNDTICNGATAYLQASAVNGVSPYTYLWNDGNTTLTDSSNTAGTFTVTITDTYGCTANTSKSIVLSDLNVNGTPKSVVCLGGHDGKIDLTVTGTDAPFTYNWNDGSHIQNRNNLAAGTYTVTVNNTVGCSSTLSFSIAEPISVLNASALTTNNVSCFNGNNGSVNLNVNGGYTPYSFIWNNGSNVQNPGGLSAGNYTVTITDFGGCSTTASASVTQPASALIANATGSNVSCNNGNNGSLNLSVSGGTAPYNFNWSNGATTQNIIQLIAGNYTVTITDANACSTTSSAVVAQPASALNVTATATAVLCNGGNTGSVTLQTTGGTSPYNYQWTNGGNTAGIFNLTAGNYSVIVTDANNCSSSAAVVVNQPSPLQPNDVTASVSCNGSTNGTAALTAQGGTVPYFFLWNGVYVNSTLNNLPAGNYNVTVNDNNGCAALLHITVTEPSPLVPGHTSSNVSCYNGNNGSISMSASGGTPPYSYKWGGGSNSPTINNLLAGTYDVTVSDAHLCSVTASVVIAQPASALNANALVNNVSCYNGSNGNVNLSVTGGTFPYNFLWSNGSTLQNLSNITSGNYSVTITDLNACSLTQNIPVSQPSFALNVNSASVNNVSCHGGNNGNITLNISGGSAPYSFVWNNGSSLQNQSNLIAGNYSVTITDINSCSTLYNVNVGEPQYALGTNMVPENVSCFGGNNGNVHVNTSGGTAPYSFQWNNGSTVSNILNVTAGNYTVTITDAHACTTTATASVAQPSAALNNNATAVNPSCHNSNNGSIVAAPTGGTPAYTYVWNDGYSWPTRTHLAAGTYTLTTTDANGCLAISTFSLVAPADITVNATHTDAKCNGEHSGNIQVLANGGTGNFSYSWNNSSTAQNLTNIAAGNYSVTVTDANNCTAQKQVAVGQPSAIVISETHNNVSCNGMNNANITTNISGGAGSYSFVWSNGATTQNILNVTAGSYSLVVTDAIGCTGSLNAVVVSQPAMLGSAINVTNVGCDGGNTGKINTTVSGGTQPYQYQWSNNATTEDLLTAFEGSYTLTITDANGCTAVANAFVNAVPMLFASGVAPQLVCANAKGSIDLTVNSGTAPYSFHWSNNTTNEDLVGVHPGNYQVEVTDANGCKYDTAFAIENLNTFFVTASGGGTVTLGQTTELHATSTGSALTTYSWTPTHSLSCAECANTVALPGQFTIYTVVGTDTNGCVAQDTVSVDVIEDHTVFAPNAFSPNDDGNNDYFQLFGNLPGLKNLSIMIFDRWGEKIFESDDINFKWDGTYKGEKVQPNVYVYVLKLVFLDGHSDNTKKGSITIVR
jgi:gliding motility-associated-like protein